MQTETPIPTTLPTEPNRPLAQDFKALREMGMDLIRQLAPDTWTDHNLHDPGINTLEELCYAISDLGYRLDFPIVDLLAYADPKRDPYTSLPPAYLILPSLPITLLDLRKIVLDVPGVQNAWVAQEQAPTPRFYYQNDQRWLTFSPTDATPIPLAGLFNIRIQPEPAYADKGRQLKQAVLEHWHACRNLGEDLSTVELIGTQNVGLNAVIEINTEESPNVLKQGLFTTLADYICPSPKFYEYETMLRRGHKPEELFTGPLLRHGFLEDEELIQSKPRTDLRISDMIRLLMQVPGVRLVKKLELTYAGQVYPWFLQLESGKLPQLNILNSHIQLVMNGQPVGTANRQELNNTFIASRAGSHGQMRTPQQRFPSPPKGRYRSPGKYASIQNHFPQIYGIGDEGIAPNAGNARKGAAKQFKAYLLLFEQILANQHAQLEHFKNLFAYDQLPENSHFAQLLEGSVPDADQVLNTWMKLEGYNQDGTEILHIRLNDHTFRIGDEVEVAGAGWSNGLYNVESSSGDNLSLVKSTEAQPQLPPLQEACIRRSQRQLLDLIRSIADPVHTANERLHRFYDHLLARYGEYFPDFTPFFAFGDREYLFLRHFLLRQKQTFLNGYPSISQARNKAFNYLDAPTNKANNSGLEKRLKLLLGLGQAESKPLYTTWKTIKSAIVKKFEVAENDWLAFLKAATLLSSFRLRPGEKVEIVDANNRVVATQLEQVGVNLSQEQQNEVVQAAWKQCWEWNMELEGLYLVEHILLRPSQVDHQSLDRFFHEYQRVEKFDFPDTKNKHLLRLTPYNIAKNPQVGETIYLIGVSTSKDLRAVVAEVNSDTGSFTVKIDDSIAAIEQAKGFWYYSEEAREKAAVFMILHHKINRFQASSNRLVCYSSKHDLETGNLIELSLPGILTELREVLDTTPDTFTVEIPKIPLKTTVNWAEQTGVWMRANARQDPFSLQVTLVLPSWPGRLQNEAFRELVIQTIREETPAHLNTYVRWLALDEMEEFEHHHQRWLSHLNQIRA